MPRKSIFFPLLLGAVVTTGMLGSIARASFALEPIEQPREPQWAQADVVPSTSGRLTVSVRGAVTGVGNLMVSLYDKERDFPGTGMHVAERVVPVTSTTTEAIFENVPFGRYAVAVVYDKNANNKLDLRWGLLPKEQVGYSRNAIVRFGQPEFKEAAFDLNEAHKLIHVALW